jgi:type II secretory pathway pseudopilin PulG
MKKTALGYTLIELLIVITLIVLLFTLGMAQYNQFNRRQILTKARDELVSNLRLVQSKSLAGEKPDACGDEALTGHKLKFIDNQKYEIVAVCGDEIDIKTGLSLPGEIIKESGPSEVFFKGLSQGTGIVVGQGEIVLAGFNETKTVTITSAGEIK